jgi:hypothetical protein
LPAKRPYERNSSGLKNKPFSPENPQKHEISGKGIYIPHCLAIWSNSVISKRAPFAKISLNWGDLTTPRMYPPASIPNKIPENRHPQNSPFSLSPDCHFEHYLVLEGIVCLKSGVLG